jgi:hypothetical protein
MVGRRNDLSHVVTHRNQISHDLLNSRLHNLEVDIDDVSAQIHCRKLTKLEQTFLGNEFDFIK